MQSTTSPNATAPSPASALGSTAPTDTTLDEACRILTISSSLDAARRFVGLVQDLSSSPSSSSSTPSPSNPSPPHPTEHTTIIPYTLSNRYYTADLHFALRAVESVALQTFLATATATGRAGGERGERRAPAVIFVWARGEPYTKHIHHLSQALQASGYEPEVCLAVRIPKATSTPAPKQVDQEQVQEEEEEDEEEDEDDDDEETDQEEEDKEEDNAEIDSTLMSFGFEYVDATQPSRTRTRAGSRTRSEAPEDEDDDIDIPALPRVIDALSTIMWPSMRSSTSASSSAKSSSSNKPQPSSQPQSQAPQAPTSLTQSQLNERTSILEELLSITDISDVWTGSASGGGSVLVGQAVERGDTLEVAEEEEEEEVMGEPVGVRYGFDRRGTGGSERPWLSGSGILGPSAASSSASTSAAKQSSLTLNPRTQAPQDPTAAAQPAPGQFTTSPTDISGSSPFGDLESGSAREGGNGNGKANVSIGFEDDFTGFVEAPMPGGGVNSSVNSSVGGSGGVDANTGGGASGSASARAGADTAADAATEPRPPIPIIDFQLTIDGPDWLFGAGTSNSPDITSGTQAPQPQDKGSQSQPQPQPLHGGYTYPAGYDLRKFLSWRATSPKPGESPHLSAYTEFGEVSDWGEGEGGSEVGDVGAEEGVYEQLGEEDEKGEWEDKDEREWEEEGLVEEDHGDDGFDEDGDEDEEGLPSKEEVRQAAQRIFGGIVSLNPPGFVFDVDGGMRWDEGEGEEGGWVGVGVGGGDKGKEGKGKEEKEKEGNKGKGKEEAPGQGQEAGVFAKASDVLKAQREREQAQGGQVASGDAEGKAKAEGTTGPSAEMKERMRRLGSMAAAADMRGVLGSSSGRSGRSGQAGGDAEEDGDLEGALEGKGAFDLERVLHSLQAMKSEIAGIEDEDEKRKMAARVALGLIYGLEGGEL